MKTHAEFDYAGSEGQQYHLSRQFPSIAEPWIGRLRASKFQPFIKTTDSVFEYGVGFGWNLVALECALKTGFDTAPGLKPLVEAKNIKFIPALAELQPSSFDVVICHHTLEHLKNPAQALETIHRLLRPSGHLLLFVPFEKERKYRRPNPNDQSHHLYSWTPASLSNLVSSVDFRLSGVRLQKFRFDRMAALAACKLKLGEQSYRFIRALGLCILPEYEIRIVAERR